jgi:NAD(P)-dependent dehydrogenase (short-subunit alcohol dehydrogenase family)
MIDLSRWEALAAQNVYHRRQAEGRLSGKIAVVTGAAQGFGRGIAEEIYAQGASVVVADLNAPLAETVAKELGERAISMRVDVTDEESVAGMVKETVERFGGLDLFISNAGVLKAGSLDELEKRDFEFVTSVNYTAFFTCVKYASRVMRAQFEADHAWSGDIIEVNSKSGLEGSLKNFAYAGSKFGGIGLVQSFALELCPYGIKVNAVCPGNFFDGPLWADPVKGLFVQYLTAGKVVGAKTVEDVRRYYESKVPMGRGCLPSDVAKAIFYAVEQPYETGQAIPVTGGQVMLN